MRHELADMLRLKAIQDFDDTFPVPARILTSEKKILEENFRRGTAFVGVARLEKGGPVTLHTRGVNGWRSTEIRQPDDVAFLVGLQPSLRK